MSSPKQLPEGIEVPEGWVCEWHTGRSDALVWFSPSVADGFPDTESRGALVAAIGDEIGRIPSEVIPYGMAEFQGRLFVYSALRDETDGHWAIGIDLAADLEPVGYIDEPAA